MTITFCSNCGGTLELKIPDGDTIHRHICSQCGLTHYQNPKVISGCLVYQNDQVLLCKRAIEPRIGLWTVPAGFMENGETTRQAAQRETIEESNANVELANLFIVANLPHANQVYLLYLAKLLDNNFHPSNESSEVRLFSKEQTPWNEIAFYTVKLALSKFFYDLDRNHFSLHEIDF
jgi:ADP-ribose pyrophosphatase YjhB (NUDIX family)